MTTGDLPGQAGIAARPVRFFFLLDCSGSMAGEKIQQLNHAIREAIPAMRETAKKNPTATLTVQVIKFADTATWHVATPTPVDQFQWQDLQTSNRTAMGAALKLVAEQLQIPPMPERALPPVICLITDGMPTDNFREGLEALRATRWNSKAVRVAIAIGRDADKETLRQFVDHPEMPVLEANNAEALADYIRWVSTTLVGSVAKPPSVPVGANQAPAVVLPPAPAMAPGPSIW
jgi:uncharacterized protein YegL